jgi:hypothetical protein
LRHRQGSAGAGFRELLRFKAAPAGTVATVHIQGPNRRSWRNSPTFAPDLAAALTAAGYPAASNPLQS